MYCLGCGVDLPNARDRRSLSSPEADDVASVWRIFMENEEIGDEDINRILSGRDGQSLSKMCKKCFAAYKTCHKYHQSIQSNMRKAIEILELAPSSSSQQPTPKRPRLGKCAHWQTPSQLSCDNQPFGSGVTAQSPDVAIRVGYTKPKTFVLTPRRKHIGKAIARKSHKTIAMESLKNPCTRKHIVKALGKELAKEIKVMASDRAKSILQSQNPEHLKQFTWDMLLHELSTYAPLLKSLLFSATRTRVARSNTDAVVGMCAAILINHRNSKMSLIQKINSLILYAGHSSKQVYQRLRRLNVTVSHSSVIRLLETVGKDFDVKVKEWRASILPLLNSSNVIQTQTAPWLVSEDQDDQLSDGSTDSDTEHDSDSDMSWMSISPITSDEEYDHSSLSSEGGSESDHDSSDDQEEPPASAPSSNHPTLPPSIPQSASLVGSQHGSTSDHSQGKESQGHPTLYHICGDNIDKGIKQRYMRVGTNKPDCFHYFHSYAVADRVDFSSLSDEVIPTHQRDKKQVALSLLPALEDDEALRDNIVTLISRILFENMEFFKFSFDGVVNWHLQHEFYGEMSTRSVVNPLGIQPRDENKTEHMVGIMGEAQKYVPMVEMIKDMYVPSLDQSVQVVCALAHPIEFAGDQKTAARARGAQKAKVNALSPSERLAGLVPVVADWHTKVKLLDVIWKYFYSPRSAGDHGTLHQLRNKLNRTNVVKTPKKDVNACEDFITIVTSGLVVAAALATFQLKSLNDYPADHIVPGADTMWTLSNSEREECLRDLCGQVYDKFVNFKFNTQAKTPTGGDNVLEYSVQLLRLGCFYMEFADAIREGDGGRVLRCWRYMLPMFSASGNTNYACEAANFLLLHSYTLSPRLSAQLLWSRFVNVHGRPGKNIPVDLHMEHLNKIAKSAIHFLGSNKSEKAITRVGRAIGTLSPVLDNFDEVNQVTISCSGQRKPKAQKDIEVIVNELVKAECFVMQEKARKHTRFPHPRNVLHAKDRGQLVDWMIRRLPSSF